MGVRDYHELAVWQLADQLRREVYDLTERGVAARDSKFREQLRNAVAKMPANVAEGFRRGSPADFARFVNYVFAGVGEVSDRLDDGCARGYWSQASLLPARRTIRRISPALSRLLRYLRSDAAKHNYEESLKKVTIEAEPEAERT